MKPYPRVQESQTGRRGGTHRAASSQRIRNSSQVSLETLKERQVLIIARDSRTPPGSNLPRLLPSLLTWKVGPLLSDVVISTAARNVSVRPAKVDGQSAGKFERIRKRNRCDDFKTIKSVAKSLMDA